MIRTSLAVLLLCAPVGAGASAQGASAQAVGAPAAVAPFRLDTAKAKAVRRKVPVGPAPAIDADRAARLAEARRRFFQKPDESTPGPVKDFGGYDYRRDSGTMSPGATFKF